MKKKETDQLKKKKNYTKPLLEMVGSVDTLTGGIAGGGATSKRSNQSDGTGVPATKAVAMPE